MAKKKGLEGEIISLVKREKMLWETGTCFVTEKVAFQMRNLIRLLRKNYYGIFDVPNDPQTGKRKIWVPLTESIVESVVKNIDTDTKDINVIAQNPNRTKLSFLVREYLKTELDKIDFGDKLDDMERNLAIDGTAVWKVMDKKQKNNAGKVETVVDIKKVDLLNFYIDPTADSIAETPAVIERAILTPVQIKAMTGWANTDVPGSTNLAKYDGEFNISGEETGETPLIEVFERWGLMPKYFLTGNDKDTELIEGHIVVSGIGQQNGETFHLVEANSSGLKPYEEAWYTRVPNRWYGKGVAEKTMWQQLYINTIVNIRITRSLISQLGLFKVKKRSGITPQMLRRLPVNGAIKVENMDDIEQFIMNEASSASYKDEQTAESWSQKVTGAFEAVTGESLPATTTATVGALQQKSAMTQFILIKKGIGKFIERVINKHVLRLLNAKFKKGDMYRVTLDMEELRELDDQMVEAYADRYINENKMLSQEAIDRAIDKARKDLGRFGSERFLKLTSEVDITEYDIKVFVQNEEVDKNLIIADLLNLIKVAPQFAEQITAQVFDTLGMNFKPVRGGQTQEQVGAPNVKSKTPTEALTQANRIPQQQVQQ